MTALPACALMIGNWLCAVCLTGTCELNPAAEAPLPTAPPYTITVSKERRAEIPAEGLSVELVDVNDTRCAVEVQCVWAGVAEITLRVSKAGGAPASLVVGTLPSKGASAPAQRTYGAYEFSLVGLEPPNSMAKPVTQSQYRATLKVAKAL